MTLKAHIDIQYLMLSNCHFRYDVDGLQYLQQRRCQMKRIGKIPHTAGHGTNRRWWIYCNTVKRLPLSLADGQRKSDFDRKPSYAHFARNGTI